MSDFFFRFAERALGLAPVAKPAVAPLFAPDPQITAEPAKVVLQRPATVANQDVAPSPAFRPETPDALPKMSLPREPMSHRLALEATHQPESPATIAVADPPATKRPITVGSVEPEVRPMEKAMSNPAPGARQSSSLVKPARRVIEPAAKETNREPDAVRPARGQFPVPSVTAPRETITPFGRRSVMADDGGQAPAVVSVNIGRIEVRAIYPEAAAQAVASLPTTLELSLTDYLKERDSGIR